MKTSANQQTAAEAVRRLCESADPGQAAVLQRFFKTGPGEYGEGDVFIGVRVPQTRKLVRVFADLPPAETKKLVRSKYHEARLLGLLIWVRQYQRGDAKQRERVYRLYTSHLDGINNWDLIDTTAEHIIGAHLWDRDRAILYEWAESDSLWLRRIALLSTFHFIKRNEYDDALRLAERLLNDEHDLIHKAAGWMLREIGKRDRRIEEAFLKQHARSMPRTMLRYAIEHFPEPKRRAYLKAAPARAPGLHCE